MMMMNLCRYFIILSNIIAVMHGITSQYYFVKRTKLDDSKDFSESIDSFSNKDKFRKEEFCTIRNATCSTKSCELCECDKEDLWISYSNGCQKKWFLNTFNNINEGNCFTIHPTNSWIPTISTNISRTNKYQLYSTNLSPMNLVTNNNICTVKQLLQVSNGTMKLSEDYADEIMLENGVTKRIQFSDKLQLKNLTGRLLMVTIDCSNQASTFNTCLLFKVQGVQHLEVIPIPLKPKEKKEDDDDVLAIVKPLVIVGCMLLVFIFVALYCLYKRKRYINKQQEERKQSETYGDSRPGTGTTSTLGNVARNVAKTSTATLLNTTDNSKVFDSPNLGASNPAYDYAVSHFTNQDDTDSITAVSPIFSPQLSSSPSQLSPSQPSPSQPSPSQPSPSQPSPSQPLPSLATDTGFSSTPTTNNKPTDTTNNNNNNNLSNDDQYFQLEKELFPDQLQCQPIEDLSNPPKFEGVSPIKSDDVVPDNDSINDNDDDLFDSDKETTNDVNELSDTSGNALYEEVMEEYNRITTLSSNDKLRALGFEAK